MRRSADRWPDHAVDDVHVAFEETADDALLPPHFTLAQFAVFEQASQLRAGSGAARRAVIRLAGAHHEVAAIGVGPPRRTEKLDVIDERSIRAGDALTLQRASDR